MLEVNFGLLVRSRDVNIKVFLCEFDALINIFPRLLLRGIFERWLYFVDFAVRVGDADRLQEEIGRAHV
jgi:hypothetical protein